MKNASSAMVSELAAVLNAPGLPEAEDRLDSLGEIVGVLAAHADVEALRQSASTLQRAWRASGQDRALRVLREAVRAAATVRAGEVAAGADRLDEQRVRERVAEVLRARLSARSSDIAEELGLGLPQVSRALRELVDRGLVTRAKNESLDGRARYYRLSPAAVRRVAPFVVVGDAIDQATLDTGLFRNDMLPLGPSDRIALETFRAFKDQLVSSVASGRYRPAPAELFPVAKDGDTSRPAALLRLPDRVVYTAIVSSLAPAIRDSVRSQVVWPRGDFASSRWNEFEASPLADAPSFVVVADIASFYDTVDHASLGDAMRECGADPSTTDVLTTFLETVMRRPVGLPQGLPASDPLATAALAPVDHALESAGIRYYRHGDDFRFPVKDRHEARRVIGELSEALRDQRLHLNTYKTHAVHAEEYERNLRLRHSAEEEVLRTIRLQAGFESGEGMVGSNEGFDPVRDPGVDELGRLDGLEGVVDLATALGIPVDDGHRVQYGRYGEIETTWLEEPDYDALLETTEVLEHVLDSAESTALATVEAMLGSRPDRWARTAHRQTLVSMLSILSLGRRTVGTRDVWMRYLTEYPEDTRAIAMYFAHLARAGDDELALDGAAHALATPFSDWQRSWLLSSLAWADNQPPASLVRALFGLLGEAEWLTRIAAAGVLQRAGILSSSLLRSLWSEAPPALRPDLVVLVGRAERNEELDRLLSTDADDIERSLAAV